MPLPQAGTSDEDLVQIVGAQGGRIAQETTLQANAVPPAAPPVSQAPAALAVMNSLLPLLETLEPETPSSMTLTPFAMPPGIPPGGPLAAQMPQSMYQVKILSILPPGVPPEPVPAGAQQGIVESVSPSGFPVVRAPAGTFILKTQATLPSGSTVVFEAQPLTPGQAIATAAVQAATPDWFDPLTSASWPALQEAMQTISSAAPMMAQAMRDVIPSPAQNMAPAALLFLAAARTGDVASWLGEPVLQALKSAGKTTLVQRLTEDFARLSGQTKDTVADGWKATSLPLRHEDGISQIQIFVRQQHDQQGRKKDEADGARPVTRFILNLRLSRLGDMQLDGLQNHRRLDLILRSAAPLSAAMRQDIMQSFQNGLRQAEMQGAVSFQPGAGSWVTVALPQRGTFA
jgi:hypothetical protein